MRVVLKEFQSEYVTELRQKFDVVQGLADRQPVAILLNAPTGSGKTLMITALIEELLEGNSDQPGDHDLVFLWLTDQPELNKQTFDKMRKTSSVLTAVNLTIIDAAVDAETLSAGNLYFLNTQKLATTSSLVRGGDRRTFSLWTTLANTVEVSPSKFVLIVDEAHRGAQGRDAAEAETIMQKFVKGSDGELPVVPLVIGISATPDHFLNLCNETGRPVFRVDVPVERVRESGLLKEFIDLYHPDDSKPSHSTMLIQAVRDWVSYRDQWSGYATDEHEYAPRPVLLCQVEDGRAGSPDVSATDLPSLVGVVAKELGKAATDGWLAHAFQEHSDLTVAGHTVRYLAPSVIDADPDVKVVLFKTSLNTGWDCPRAEVMVSFRTARDETNIAQLVGRMVRAPLARRIDSNEHLNTVALYLPYYDQKTVEKVVSRLTEPGEGVPSVTVRDGSLSVLLARAPDKAECFSLLEKLPTQTVPLGRMLRPVPRLARLAGLLAEMGLEKDPVKTYRNLLVAVLDEERARLEKDGVLKALVNEAGTVDIRRRRVTFGVPNLSATNSSAAALEENPVQAVITDRDVEDLYASAGRKLGEGLHKAYVRSRLGNSKVSSRSAKLELHALVERDGVLERVNSAADAQRKAWMIAYKASINSADERYAHALRDIEAAGSDPETTTIVAPSSVEWSAADAQWPKHLYVDGDGLFRADFGSSWERKVVASECARSDIVGWLRNPPRKPWSLCIARQSGTQWTPFYPDFIFFRETPGGIIADIVDPHLLMAEDMPQRAVALARYAQDHGTLFGRIEMVIYEGEADLAGKRLDLGDEEVRGKVALLTTHEQLRSLFFS